MYEKCRSFARATRGASRTPARTRTSRAEGQNRCMGCGVPPRVDVVDNDSQSQLRNHCPPPPRRRRTIARAGSRLATLVEEPPRRSTLRTVLLFVAGAVVAGALTWTLVHRRTVARAVPPTPLVVERMREVARLRDAGSRGLQEDLLRTRAHAHRRAVERRAEPGRSPRSFRRAGGPSSSGRCTSASTSRSSTPGGCGSRGAASRSPCRRCRRRWSCDPERPRSSPATSTRPRPRSCSSWRASRSSAR